MVSLVIEYFLLFIAGLVGGFLNSIAGGGSFVTFPALVFAGVPPLVANATNTFSSCAGYLSGAYALRHRLSEHRREVIFILVLSMFGGLAGANLLLGTSESSFEKAIPWLLLFATLLFTFGDETNSLLNKYTSRKTYGGHLRKIFLFFMLFGVSIYGGFFNAGLGVVVLSYLTLSGYSDIHIMNGIKLVVSSSVSFVAIVLFIVNDSIVWLEGGIVLIGSLLGGYTSARLSMQVPQKHVRQLVILMSYSITTYFFYSVYFR